MKYPAFLLLLNTLFFSCTKRQYLVFDSHLPQNDRKEFVYKQRDFLLTYSFDPSNNLMVTIKNKTSDFLRVDWSKSSIVFEEQLYPFVDGSVSLSGTAIRDVVGDFTTESSGKVNVGGHGEYIPPRASTTMSIAFPPQNFEKFSNQAPYEKVYLGHVSAKKYIFDPADSLRYFESFIFLNESEDESDYLNHQFWVSEIWECVDGPSSNQPNQIVLSRMTETSKVITAAIVLPMLLIVASADEED